MSADTASASPPPCGFLDDHGARLRRIAIEHEDMIAAARHLDGAGAADAGGASGDDDTTLAHGSPLWLRPSLDEFGHEGEEGFGGGRQRGLCSRSTITSRSKSIPATLKTTSLAALHVMLDEIERHQAQIIPARSRAIMQPGGIGFDLRTRRLQSDALEYLDEARPQQTAARRQHEGIIEQVGGLDLLPLRERMLCSRGEDELILEKKRGGKVRRDRRGSGAS